MSQSSVVRLVALRDQSLSVPECHDIVADPRAGGTGLFVGAVRSDDAGREVTALEYSAHPGALPALHAVADRVARTHQVCGIAVVHRVGLLAIGDLAVVVAASAPHRDEAFAATRMLIEDLKATVPIWKRQVFGDGEEQWVGSP